MPQTFFILFKTYGGLFQKPLYCPQFFVNLHLKRHGFMVVLFPEILIVKGQGHDIQFKYLDKNERFWQQLNYLSWFLNFQNAPLVTCNHCYFPCGLGENIVEKFIRDIFIEFLCGPRCSLLVHYYSFSVFFIIAKRPLEDRGETVKFVQCNFFILRHLHNYHFSKMFSPVLCKTSYTPAAPAPYQKIDIRRILV